MEKLIYLVWGEAERRRDRLAQELRGALAPVLDQAHRVTLSVADDAVAVADSMRQGNLQPSPDAYVSFWVDTAFRRAPLEQALRGLGLRIAGYLVTESEPLVVDQPLDAQQRVPGMCQLVTITRPPRLSPEEFFDIWLNSHTQVAIDTQSTFGYRQNVVARVLTYGAPDITCIVEENFPEAAMTSPLAFYDAGEDKALLKERVKTMMDSCARFIDPDKLDVVPTSEYRLKV